VNGLALPVTAASIDANGDINLTFFAAHNAVLFQIVELTGFRHQTLMVNIKGFTNYKQDNSGRIIRSSVTANGSKYR
jgi:hypothetical protein